MMVLSAHQSKIFKEGCKKEVLMQYKCMEKEIRKLHGRILYPICHVDREYSGRNAALAGRKAMNLCIQASDFPSPMSRGPEIWERILQIRREARPPIKNTDTILCSMSPHSRTTSSRRLQDFPVCSALTPDSERPAILSGRDLYPCFCAVIFPYAKRYEEMIDISSSLFSTVKTPDSSHADAR